MKLLNAVPVAVASLLVAGLLSLQTGVYDDWLAEQGPAPYSAPIPLPDTLKAFPGAWGKAANAFQTARDSVINGSWSVKVWKITTTNATGDGSFVDILEDSIQADAFNFVIPDVYGLITATNTSIIPKSGIDNVYIAGQAGPGGGIALRGFRLRMNDGGWDDWVMRYIRWNGLQSGALDNIRIIGGERIYLDHITTRWARNMNVNVGADTADLSATLDGATIANSMIYDPHDSTANQPICYAIDGDPFENAPIHNVLLYQNFTMNCGWRAPFGSGDTIVLENNISFNNQQDQSGSLGGDLRADYLRNYAKRGGWTSTGTGNSGHWMFAYYNQTPYPASNPSLHLSGNRHALNGMNPATPDDSAWTGSKRILAFYRDDGTYTEGEALPIGWKRSTALDRDYHPWPQHTPNDVWRDSVILTVGASQKVDSTGNWTFVTSTGVNVRDFYDSLRIAQFSDSVGADWSSAGVDTDTLAGSMTPRAGAAIGDTDDDALPDAYELRICGTTTCLPNDSVAPNYGYLAIEMYLAGLHFDASPGGGLSPVPPTYADGRIAYLIDVVVDTVILRDTLGNAVGTIYRRGPNPDSIDSGTGFYAILVSDRDSSVVLTYDTLTLGAGARDSAFVDSVLADYGLTYPPTPWDVSVPGEP